MKHAITSRTLSLSCKGALGALAMVCLGGAAQFDNAPDNTADTEECEIIIVDGEELQDCHLGTTVTGTSPSPSWAEAITPWWDFGTGWSLFSGPIAGPTPFERMLERGLDRLEQEADEERQACITAVLQKRTSALDAIEAMRLQQLKAESDAYQALAAEEDEDYRDQLNGCADTVSCIDRVTVEHNATMAALNANYDLGKKIANETAGTDKAAAVKSADDAITACQESGI